MNRLKRLKEIDDANFSLTNPNVQIIIKICRRYALIDNPEYNSEEPLTILVVKNASIELQKRAIRDSGYDLEVIWLCNNWEDFDQKFVDEIMENLMIKDIIE
jgi:hypothetical protein